MPAINAGHPEVTPRQIYLIPPEPSTSPDSTPGPAVHVAIRDRKAKRRVLDALQSRQDIRVSSADQPGPAAAHVRVVLARELTKHAPHLAETPRVLALGDVADDSTLIGVWQCGAWGLLELGCSGADIAAVARRLFAGECQVLDAVSRRPAAARLLLSRLVFADRSNRLPFAAISPLSPRQVEILAAITKGESGTVIADRMHLGKQTVKNYVQDILTKTGAKTRAQAAAVAVSLGWLALQTDMSAQPGVGD